jgi:hypothetical protein
MIRYVIATLLLFVSCSSARDPMIISFTFRNEAKQALDWVRLEGSKIDPIAGIMPPGSIKTTHGLKWQNENDAKVTFVDDSTRRRFTIGLSFEAANARIKTGQCRHVIVTIVSTNEARVTCE